jgi:hypothetical protein
MKAKGLHERRVSASWRSKLRHVLLRPADRQPPRVERLRLGRVRCAAHSTARRQMMATWRLDKDDCKRNACTSDLCAGRDPARCSHQALQAGRRGGLALRPVMLARTELRASRGTEIKLAMPTGHDAQRAAVAPIAMARAPATCERVRYSRA